VAVVRVTLGNRAAENVDISSVAGPVSGVYTVTLSSPPTADTVIGDTLTDENATPRSYLIVGIIGSDLEVKDTFGASAAPDASGTSQATTIRTYSGNNAINLANADADDTGLYTSGDIAEWAVCEKVTISTQNNISNGGTVGLSHIKLFGHENYRPSDSTPTTGWIDDPTGNLVMLQIIPATGVEVTVAYLAVSKTNPSATNNRQKLISILGGTVNVHHNWVYTNKQTGGTGSVFYGISSVSGSPVMRIHNNQVWNIDNPGAGLGDGIFLTSAGTGTIVYNNTIYGCGRYGFVCTKTAAVFSNNILMGNVTEDMSSTSTPNAASNYNYSSDATAPGGLSLHSQVVADTFVDADNSDFHQKSTSTSRTFAANLTGAATDIETDIEGNERPASPTGWDAGAYHYVAPPLSAIPCVAAPVSGSFEF